MGFWNLKNYCQHAYIINKQNQFLKPSLQTKHKELNKLSKNNNSSGFYILLPLANKTNGLNFTYNKKEKLKSKKLIDQLFTEGQSVSAYPLRLVYLSTSFDDAVIAKTGVSVSKRNFKTAVDRNRIKRLLRESYRLNKAVYFNNITTQYAFMILYIGKDLPTLTLVETKMKLLFEKFSNTTSKT